MGVTKFKWNILSRVKPASPQASAACANRFFLPTLNWTMLRSSRKRRTPFDAPLPNLLSAIFRSQANCVLHNCLWTLSPLAAGCWLGPKSPVENGALTDERSGPRLDQSAESARSAWSSMKQKLWRKGRLDTGFWRWTVRFSASRTPRASRSAVRLGRLYEQRIAKTKMISVASQDFQHSMRGADKGSPDAARTPRHCRRRSRIGREAQSSPIAKAAARLAAAGVEGKLAHSVAFTPRLRPHRPRHSRPPPASAGRLRSIRRPKAAATAAADRADRCVAARHCARTRL
jgi:hypothetical protein